MTRDNSKKPGYVYLARNSLFKNEDGQVLLKIGKCFSSGKCDDLKARIKGLPSTGAPGEYKCIYAIYVNNVDYVEKLLHNTFRALRHQKNREFFAVDVEDVKAAMNLILASGKITKEIKDYISGKKTANYSRAHSGQTEGTPERKSLTLQKQSPTSDGKFRGFDALDIPPGAKLTFLNNSTIQATVCSDNRVKYKGEERSLSGAAGEVRLSQHKKPTVAGPRYWLYEGKTISQITRDMSGKKQLTISEHTRGKQRVTPERKSPTPQKQSPTKRKNLPPFKLSNYQNLKGAVLTFHGKSPATVKVAGDEVIFKDGDVPMSLSNAARIVLEREGRYWKEVRGPSYWKYKGELLTDMKNRMAGKS